MNATPNTTPSSGGRGFGLVTMVLVVLGVFALYYLYRFLYTSAGSTTTTLISKKIPASEPPSQIPKIPTPFEGGEYTFSTWIYVNSFNRNLNTRKHIFELMGQNFSTLVVGLGAFRNSLVVRVHNRDLPAAATAEGFATDDKDKGTTPPNAEDGYDNSTSLTSKELKNMFEPNATEDSLLKEPPMCDLPEVDLQRWVLITVVLSGRTVDVYLDGKLARSCIGASYYKVDPTGVEVRICEKGGFDGFVSGMTVANYALNPDEIYRMYLSGPEGVGGDIFSWLATTFGLSPSGTF